MANHFTNILICIQDPEQEIPVDLPSDLCEWVDPMPPVLRNLPRWYDWAVEHWGTKWGTYSHEVTQLGGDCCPFVISFITAWGPPHPEMMRQIVAKLKAEFAFDEICHVGVDPYDGDIEVVGEVAAKTGDE